MAATNDLKVNSDVKNLTMNFAVVKNQLGSIRTSHVIIVNKTTKSEVLTEINNTQYVEYNMT